MEEKELLDQFRRSGDIAILGALFEPYMSLLYGLCFKYLQHEAKSQDAVMDIFDELRGKLRVHQVENFKSWLYVYARNHCLMKLRAGKSVRMLDIDEYLYESEQKLIEPEDERWTEQDYQQLSSCIAGLAEPQQLCIRLFYLEQYCYKDIASKTGFTLSKVKSYIQNGRRNLKACMERKDHGK